MEPWPERSRTVSGQTLTHSPTASRPIEPPPGETLVRPSHRSNPRGLTLTEVMAVIGIIVVLLAILLPGLATIRKAGEQTVSESSLRQIFTY